MGWSIDARGRRPKRHPAEPTLPWQISAIAPTSASSLALPVRSGQARSKHSDPHRSLPDRMRRPIRQDDIPLRAGLNSLDRLSEGIWAHRSIPRGSYSATEIAAFGRRRTHLPAKQTNSSFRAGDPTTCIKFGISIRSKSPRTGSKTRMALSFRARKYSADGT